MDGFEFGLEGWLWIVMVGGKVGWVGLVLKGEIVIINYKVFIVLIFNFVFDW